MSRRVAFGSLVVLLAAIGLAAAHSSSKDEHSHGAPAGSPALQQTSTSPTTAPRDCPGGCDDANPCTDDACDPTLGCIHTYNTQPCTDGNACTTNDTCAYGSCVGGDPAPGCSPCSSVAVVPPGGGTFTGTTSGSSAMQGSCLPGAPSPERVFRFTPVTSGTTTIETCGPQTTFDTILYARADSCTGAELACDDDGPCATGNSPDQGSRIQIQVTAGQTYFIVVDGYNGAHGSFQLSVSSPSTCGNNVREGAEECDGTDSGGCGQGTCDAACHCAPAAALPDLIAEIVDWYLEPDATVDPGDVAEGCAEQVTGSDLLRFGVRTRNIGTGDMVLGPTLCPTPCTDHPLEICGNPKFICSPAGGHNHGHYLDYASYELLDSSNQVVVVGHKQGFCLHDGYDAGPCPNHQFPDCTVQGMSAGCADLYESTLGCQYLDITGIPPGSYTLRVIVDPLNKVAELNDNNNTVTTPVTITADACSSVTPIPAAGGTVAGTTSGASTHSGTCAAEGTAPEKAYAWTPTVSGVATIQTCSATATNFDTVLYVHTGSCEGAELACNDDGPCSTSDPGLPHSGSRIDLPVVAGQTYYVFVDGYLGAQGSYSLSVTSPPCGANGAACNDGNACTSGDRCIDNVCVGTAVSTPAPVNDSLRLQQGVGGTTLTWLDDPGPFSVYRGLHPAGLPWSSVLGCVSGSLTSSVYVDGTSPASGALQWYLVTRRGSCGESLAGVGSDGTPILALPPCP